MYIISNPFIGSPFHEIKVLKKIYNREVLANKNILDIIDTLIDY